MKLKLTKKSLKLLLLCSIAWVAVAPSYGQIGSNIYTPYSMYGIGSLELQGNSVTKQMGGIGAALRSTIYQNNINPASYSAVPQKSFLVSFGLQGTSNYISNTENSSSHNGLALGDFGVLFPAMKGLGIGVSITPMSTVGYATAYFNTPDDILEDIGTVAYSFSGTGNIVQYKVGAGYKIYKGLSVGANVAYYHGMLNQYSTMGIVSVVDNKNYKIVGTYDSRSYDYFGMDLGFQYMATLDRERGRSLCIGAVYQPKVSTTVPQDYLATIAASSNLIDTVSINTQQTDYTMPSKITAGITYNTRKLTIGVDYVYQDWTDAFAMTEVDGVSLTKYEDFRFGLEYTPSRFDIRTAMKRWSYRAGFRYGTSYLMVNDEEMKDFSATFGVGIPVERNGFSLVNAGVEVGRTGYLNSASLERDIYVKVQLGFTLFGQGDWFVRYKFK